MGNVHRKLDRILDVFAEVVKCYYFDECHRIDEVLRAARDDEAILTIDAEYIRLKVEEFKNGNDGAYDDIVQLLKDAMIHVVTKHMCVRA